MDNARNRFLKLLSCIQHGSVENAPTLVTDLDRMMYAAAMDDDTYDDQQEVYVVASATPYSSGWLSKTSGGTAFTPIKGILYIVVSNGDYKNQIYRWDGSNYIMIGDGVGKQQFTVTITKDTNTSSVVLKNQFNQIIGSKATFGDTVTITATAASDYEISTLTLNGESFTNGESVVVSGALTIAVTTAAVEAAEQGE